MLTGRSWALRAAALTTRGVSCGAPMLRRALNVVAAVCVMLASPTFAAGDTRQVVLSSQTASLRVQTPAMSPSAAVLVASGAEGWRGLTRDIGDQVSADGYVVIGLDTRSYLMEATRRAGALSSVAVGEDYLAVLRHVHEWFPDIHHVFLLGVSEGGGLALVAAADPRVGAQLVIYGTHDIEPPIDTTHQIFERGGEPRRLTVLATERPLFNDARESLFDAVHACLAWSTHVRQPASTHVSAAGVLASRGTR